MKKIFILVFSLASLASVSAGQQEVSMSELALVTQMMEEQKNAATQTKKEFVKKESTEKTRMQKLLQSKIVWALSGIVGVGAAIGALCYWNMPKGEKRFAEESFEEETSEFEVDGDVIDVLEIDDISDDQGILQNLIDEKSDLQNMTKTKSERGLFGDTEPTLTSVAKDVGRVCLVGGTALIAVFVAVKNR